MADHSDASGTGYHMTIPVVNPQSHSNPMSSYSYDNRQNYDGNTTYGYHTAVSNDFTGEYKPNNAYNGDSAQYANYHASGSYSTNYVPTYQNQYPDSSNYDHSANSQYYAHGSYENPAPGDQGYTHQYSQANYSQNEDCQVNSQHHYTQSDQYYADGYSSSHSHDHDSHQKGESPSYRYERPEDEREDEEYYREVDRRGRSSRSVSSRDSYHRHRRKRKSKSSSGSYYRKERRRSRSSRRRRSRSRERRSRHRHRHRRRRSRSSDRHSHRDRQRERSSDRRSDRRDSKDREDVVQDVVEKARMLRTNEIERRRLKDIEEAQRDDLTVLVANMSLSVDERDIYELFSEHAGKVRDIQCVRDVRSGRSKGIAYVEFYTQEAVIKALSMTGMTLRGQVIRVQSSQAEKNRAARAAKQLQDSAIKETDNPTTIVVSNLVGILSNLGEADLQQLFAPFGNIVEAAVARNEMGNSKGYAYIRFKRWNEAKEALNVMNGFDVSGQQIKVAYATTKKGKGRLNSLGDLDIERIDDDDAGLISGSSNKIALMKKLQERQPSNSSVVVLSNMYTSEDHMNNPDFFGEIEEDVKEECSKYGSVSQVYLNRRRPDGKVYVRFRNNDEALAAQKGLQGRYFAGNTIQVALMAEDQFNSLTNRS